MPNWAIGSIYVKGKPKNVLSFCELFLWNNKPHKKKYFARSFPIDDFDKFKKDLTKEIKNKNEIIEALFNIEFAWSCYTCLVNGYPQDNPNELYTIQEATKKFKVFVEIQTEEESLMFKEFLTSNEKGILDYNSKDMNHICDECGEEVSDKEEKRIQKELNELETNNNNFLSEHQILCDNCRYNDLQKLIKKVTQKNEK